MRLLLLCVLVLAVVGLGEGYQTYKGYKLVQVVPVNEQQSRDLHSLAGDLQLDFWTEWKKPGLPVHVMIPPRKLRETLETIVRHDMDFEILNHDIGVQVEEERARLAHVLDDKMAFNISDYNTYEDIMTEIDAMASRCPPEISCVVETLGSSYEGRAIKVLRITSGQSVPGIWMDAGIHAREWLSPATVLRLLDLFTTSYGSDPEVTALIDSYDWHFVPAMNPDGYEWTWSDDRYWRKSRSPNNGSACMGTDLNRNYDTHWSEAGSSDSPCSTTYHGSSAASEIETQVIQNELVRLGSSVVALVSVHTYAQMWLHPWSFTVDGTCARLPDHDNVYQVVTATADATENTYGTTWTRGTFCEVLYPGSGTTIDYARETAGITFTYTPELRGEDFVAPPSYIEPSFQEFYNGIKAMIAEIEVVMAPLK